MSVSGFSVKTGLPALMAASICSACTRMRRRQHDRVDHRIASTLARSERSARPCWCAYASAFSGWRTNAGDEADLVALALNAVDEILAPPAEPHDGCIDHVRMLSFSARAEDACVPLREFGDNVPAGAMRHKRYTRTASSMAPTTNKTHAGAQRTDTIRGRG